jgi:glutathione S-transferase
MPTPIIYGPALSTYTRTVRLALEEKGAAYQLSEVDIFAGGARAPEHTARHPFGLVLAFEHDGFTIYETSAITRYIDEAFPGAALQPGTARDRARMNQVIGVLDAYAYRTIVTKLVVQRLVVPMTGGAADESVIAEALPQVRQSLAAFDALNAGAPFIAGAALSLADLFLGPVFAYLTATPESDSLLAPHPGLRRWWESFSPRRTMQKTAPSFG